MGNTLYLVVSGRLQIVREIPGGTNVIGEVGPGETVGEVALLGGQRRLATIIAVRDTQLASLSFEAFQGILGKHPPRRRTILCSSIGGNRRQTGAIGIVFIPGADGCAGCGLVWV